MSKLLELATELVYSSIQLNIYTPSPIEPTSNLDKQTKAMVGNLGNPPPPSRGTNNNTVHQLSSGEIYRNNPIPPSLKRQLEIMGANSGNPPPPSRGIESNTVHKMTRGEIYGGNQQPLNTTEQALAMVKDSGNPPPSSRGVYDHTVHQLSRGEIYKTQDQPFRPDFSKASDAPSRNVFAPLEGQIDKPFAEAHRLGNLYDDGGLSMGERGGKYSSINSPAPSQLRFFDVFAVAHWMRNVGRELGLFSSHNNDPITGEGKVERTAEAIVKGLTWVATQTLLTSLNPDSPYHAGALGTIDNQLWNPLSLPLSAIPLTRPDLGVGVSLRAAQGEFIGQSGDIYKEKQPVDPITLNVLAFTRLQDNIEEVGLENKSQLAALFDTAQGFRPFRGDISDRSIFPARKSIPFTSTPNIVNARFINQKNQEKFGLIEGDPLPDKELYFPFMFQDLRDNPPKFLYFRAFLKEGLSENFTPEWQQQRYYGRVDAVPTYIGTTRTVNLGFDVVAWTPADLPIIWTKLHKLQSMVYPMFDTKGFLKAGPIIRMRIGDLICASQKRGLPGYITSLNFAYDDGIWNLETDYKVPRKISVTLSYTVVHDKNVGIVYDELFESNAFGGISYNATTKQSNANESDVRGVNTAVSKYHAQAFGDLF